MKLSENFTLSEFTRSEIADRQGIDNTPTGEVVANLQELCRKVLQPLRDAWRKPLRINSGYRCSALNKVVGGVANSQHVTGNACDIVSDNPRELADFIVNSDVWQEVDQLGIYGSFVHVSHRTDGGRQRQMIFRGKR